MGLLSDGLYYWSNILPNFWSIHWAQGKTYLPCCIEHLTISKIWLNIDIFLHEGQSVNEWRGKEFIHAKPPVRRNTGHHACMRARVCVRRTHAYCHSLFRERICGTQCIHQHCQDSCKVFCYFLTLGFCVCVCVCQSCLTGLLKHFQSPWFQQQTVWCLIGHNLPPSCCDEASITMGLLICD